MTNVPSWTAMPGMGAGVGAFAGAPQMPGSVGGGTAGTTPGGSSAARETTPTPRPARRDDANGPNLSLHLSTGPTGPNSRLLYHPDDRESLSDLVCLVRSQIEVFAATEEDIDTRAPRAVRGGSGDAKSGKGGGGGGREAVSLGRVGIRCRWCCNPQAPALWACGGGGGTNTLAHLGIGLLGPDGNPVKPPSLSLASTAAAPKVRGAVSYPKSIRLIYQAVRNWQRHHLMVCPAIPDEVKRDYLAMKSVKWQRRSGNASTVYWESHCRRLGLVDTEDGIKVSEGRCLGRADATPGTAINVGPDDTVGGGSSSAATEATAQNGAAGAVAAFGAAGAAAGSIVGSSVAAGVNVIGGVGLMGTPASGAAVGRQRPPSGLGTSAQIAAEASAVMQAQRQGQQGQAAQPTAAPPMFGGDDTGSAGQHQAAQILLRQIQQQIASAQGLGDGGATLQQQLQFGAPLAPPGGFTPMLPPEIIASAPGMSMPFGAGAAASMAGSQGRILSGQDGIMGQQLGVAASPRSNASNFDALLQQTLLAQQQTQAQQRQAHRQQQAMGSGPNHQQQQLLQQQQSPNDVAQYEALLRQAQQTIMSQQPQAQLLRGGGQKPQAQPVVSQQPPPQNFQQRYQQQANGTFSSAFLDVTGAFGAIQEGNGKNGNIGMNSSSNLLDPLQRHLLQEEQQPQIFDQRQQQQANGTSNSALLGVPGVFGTIQEGNDENGNISMNSSSNLLDSLQRHLLQEEQQQGGQLLSGLPKEHRIDDGCDLNDLLNQSLRSLGEMEPLHQPGPAQAPAQAAARQDPTQYLTAEGIASAASPSLWPPPQPSAPLFLGGGGAVPPPSTSPAVSVVQSGSPALLAAHQSNSPMLSQTTPSPAAGSVVAAASQPASATPTLQQKQQQPSPSFEVASPLCSVGGVDVGGEASPGVSLGGLPREVLLERVGLAHTIVQTIGSMRQFSPFEDAEGDGGQHDKGGDDDLVTLGVELYELFSGRHPFDDDNNDAAARDGDGDGRHEPESSAGGGTDYTSDASSLSGTNSAGGSGGREGQARGQRKRRDRKSREVGGHRKRYTPLSELGLPPALCSIVSNLLDSGQKAGGKQEVGSSSSGGSGDYKSTDEVEEDLRILFEDPGRFLFVEARRPTETFVIAHDTLYGRQQEIQLLLEAYGRTTSSLLGGEAASTVLTLDANNSERKKSEMVVISGYAGTGKSSIVRHALPLFVERGARCVSGKFDAIRQVQPLSAVVAALDEYCDHLSRLEEGGPGGLAEMRSAIVGAVGGEGNILVDLMPNLKKVIGRTDAPSVQVGGREAQQRLTFLFRMLFRATCSPAHPMVLFLDDLQWADEPSLELLRVLATDDQIRSLLLVVTYRDNEVGPDHPLNAHLREIQRSGTVAITPIAVGNMDAPSINALVAQTLRMTPRSTRPLSKAVAHKTGGNALFAVQFLSSLVDSGLLRYALTIRRWEWDLGRIEARDIGDDVVELMRAKLLRLDTPVRGVLRVAAAFGMRFREELLRILDRDRGGQGEGVLVAGSGGLGGLLDVTVAEGIMTKSGSGGEGDSSSSYHFSHDQVWSAAYMLIAESDRPAFHLRTGRCLWRCATAEELETHLFTTVDQLHRGAALIDDGTEKIDLARLCLRAGQKANGMSAFLPASVYLKAGIGLLADGDWERNRDLCLDLHNACCETEYILADFNSMRKHLGHVLQRAQTLREKLTAYFTLVQSLGAQGHLNDAIDTAIKVLGHLGEVIRTPTHETVKADVMATRQLLENVTEESLMDMKIMEDTDKKEAMRFLNVSLLYSFLEKKQHHTMCTCRMVRLSLQHGVCRESAVAFVNYGLITCATRDYRRGYRYGKMAILILNRFHAKEFQSRVHAIVHGYLNNWIEPLQSCLPEHKHAIEVGLLTGDAEFAMINAQLYLGTALSCGSKLGPLLEEFEMYTKQMVEYHQLSICKLIKPLHQVALNFLGRSVDPTKLVGEELDEDSLPDNAEEGGNNAFTSMVFFYRMWVAYVFGALDVAADMAEKNSVVETHRRPRFAVLVNHTFYKGLIALAIARRTEDGGGRWRLIANKAVEQMKVWVETTEWNCRHKLELLEAEFSYLNGDLGRAAEAYGKAACTAAEHRFIHEQALALERAGIFHMETGDHAAATGLFVQARDCYEQWGALGKAKHVQEQFL